MRQFAVIGVGRFGFSVAQTLAERGFQVLVIDKDETKVAEIADKVTHALCLDATDEMALREVGISDFDVVVVAVGENITASILITLLVKEQGAKYVIAKCITDLQAKVLRKIGVDRIIFPERDTGVRLAESLTTPNIFDYISLSPHYSILELKAPKKFLDKTLRELNIRAQYGVSVIAVRRKKPVIEDDGEATLDVEEEVIISPGPEEKIFAGDILVVIGTYENLKKMGSI